MSLPQGLDTFKVTWKTLQGVADGPDPDDTPDVLPVNGTVTFTPRITETTLVSADGSVSLFLDSVTATVGADGILVNSQGDPWVRLISPNSPGLTDQGWTWQATFKVNKYTKAQFDFTGEAEQSYSLADLTPVAASPGTITLRGPAGPGVPLAGVSGAVLVKKSDTDYDTEWAETDTLSTPGSVVRRAAAVNGDEGGWFRASIIGLDFPPSTDDHATRKDYVDGRIQPIEDDWNAATNGPTPHTFVYRDSVGRAQFADPASDYDATNMQYVNTRLDGLTLKRITQADYDALPTPRDLNILYVIEG